MDIYIDGSHTFYTSRNTGIERVVRKLSENLVSLSSQPDVGIQVKLVSHHKGKFSELGQEPGWMLSKLNSFESNAVSHLPKAARGIFRGISSPYFLPGLKPYLFPEPSHLGAYKVPHNCLKYATRSLQSLKGSKPNWGQQAYLILPDAYWTGRSIWEAVADARQAGTKIVTIFYDLIPISHPHFVGERRTEKFRRYLEKVISHSDLIVAISKSVREDLREYVKTHLPHLACDLSQIQSIRLGADFHAARGPVRDSVKEFFVSDDKQAHQHPYIVVGSLDPRKNHIQVLKAFEKLHSMGAAKPLAFIGRKGGLSDKLLEEIAISPLKPKHFRYFEDLSDSELSFAYKNSEAVIMPSEVEGFGLPIAEALWHGASVFASDIPIHREVGGQGCDYFELHNVDSLVELILSRSGQKRTQPTPDLNQQVNWRDSSIELVELCKNIA